MKIIEIENLTKYYKLGTIGHGSLSKDLQSYWAKLRGKEDPNQKLDSNTESKDGFFALDHVSFDVNQGDRLGIIGRNGAGKSTLLKILSRVTIPTSGKVKIAGRIASLLEVGTGFHPDLSGRDNVFLNGSILGMSRKEISKKFDEIVSFSDLDKFIDTPVKRYSSGMYVRLAFAVAAHLDPDILVVDEVLAVGDYSFQKKCLGKMEDLNENEGRTIIFVSHDMNVLQKLCNRGIYLEKGKVQYSDGNMAKVINKYITKNITNYDCTWINNENKYKHKNFQPLKFYICDKNSNQLKNPIDRTNEIFISIEGFIEEESELLQVGFECFDEFGVLLYQTVHTDSKEFSTKKLKKGANKLLVKIPTSLLNEGSYQLSLLVILHFKEFIIEKNKNPIEIQMNIKGGFYSSDLSIKKRVGILAPVLDWSVIK